MLQANIQKLFSPIFMKDQTLPGKKIPIEKTQELSIY